MTVGASRAEPTITHKPALAPSPQPRPAPTARVLPAEPAAQRGPFWMPIRGPDPTPIDNVRYAVGHKRGECGHRCIGDPLVPVRVVWNERAVLSFVGRELPRVTIK